MNQNAINLSVGRQDGQLPPLITQHEFLLFSTDTLFKSNDLCFLSICWQLAVISWQFFLQLFGLLDSLRLTVTRLSVHTVFLTITLVSRTVLDT